MRIITLDANGIRSAERVRFLPEVRLGDHRAGYGSGFG